VHCLCVLHHCLSTERLKYGKRPGEWHTHLVHFLWAMHLLRSLRGSLPTGAIKLGPDFELASFSAEDLTIRAEFRLAACSQCGAYFTSAKELDHVIALLDQAGLPLKMQPAAVRYCVPARNAGEKSICPGLKYWFRRLSMADYNIKTDSHYAVRPNEAVDRLKGTLLKDIQRSAYVYRVDCGGCNGCEIEIFAAITPLFDAERFGIKVVSSPRHADILVYTGAVTRSMRVPALRAYHAAPEPKICVAYGACGCSGGIFHDLYCVWGALIRFCRSTCISQAAHPRRLQRSMVSR